MQRKTAADFPPDVLKLFDGYVHGRISRRDLELFGFPATRNPECFVCGPGAFVESVGEMLSQCGHPASSIRTEWAIGTIGAAA